jgi:hypothetical protein
VGAVAGLATCVVYPLLVFAPLPEAAAVVLAALMGPLLAGASWGLRYFIDLGSPRASAELAAISNTLAGALLTGMFMIQIAVKSEVDPAPEELQAVWLGLDVAWDVYVALGTILFGIAMLGHPRFGWFPAISGILIGLALLVLNLATFPEPPADAGLVDLGPLLGIWYLAVTLRVFLSWDWAASRARDQATSAAG